MMVKTNAKRHIDGKVFSIITGHANKGIAQEYAQNRRKRGDKVRVIPCNILNKKVHGIWVCRKR